jgi:hypothetical protein
MPILTVLPKIPATAFRTFTCGYVPRPWRCFASMRAGEL